MDDPAAPVVDDDVDFYDDEPGVDRAAISPPVENQPGENQPGENQPVDNRSVKREAEKSRPENPWREPQAPREADQGRPDQATAADQQDTVATPSAVPDPAPVSEPEPEPAASDTPTSREPFFVPDSAPHPTRRVPTFDDVNDERTAYIGGIRLPASIESDLQDRERPAWRPPLLVWVITGLFISLMTMCTFLYPAFTGYDEPFHVDMTYSYYNGNGFYA
ncbi:MAG TPA: hypothetical protein VHX59_18605, partial [Mycobacteriales bacterium]|nr:hypothetical protein [Mycobacteriales bacterium]